MKRSENPQGRENSLRPVVVIGAGPAGLSAAYELSRYNRSSLIVEQDNVVGGLSRTAEYKGYCFDIGGHRFFTKVTVVQEMWHAVLGADLLKRPRLSRIYYQSKFFKYPIEPFNALTGLGPVESLHCLLSYARARVAPHPVNGDLESWLTNQFGRRLYEIFFKTYTEKVWGMPCTEIGAEWAAQRIRGLSMLTLLGNAFGRYLPGESQSTPKTLIEEFEYPRRGPGMMWNRTRELVESRGNRVLMSSPLLRIHWRDGRVLSVEAGDHRIEGDHFISSMPIRELIAALVPGPPKYLEDAAESFTYRDFLTVALVIKRRELFPDNWIYIHDPSVKVGRIQNYGNWSQDMVPDPATTCLGLEYFCFEGDSLWTKPDRDLIRLATHEVAQLGLARPEDVVDGTVVRMEKAYPIYNKTYPDGLRAVRRFLESVPNLQLVGRNGMHRYNNQDHSMLTGILAARNILGRGRYDLWKVNADTDYHEDGFRITEAELTALEQTQPLAPERR
jgi:protoporphyrinogen oxidase